MSGPVPRPGGQRALALAGGAAFALATLGVIGLGSWRPAFVLVVPLLLVALAVGLWRAARAPGRPPIGRLATLAGLGMLGAVAGVALALAAAWATIEGGGAVVAGAVIALGLAVAASAFGGARLRWLALPAFLIAIPAGVVVAADLRQENLDVRPSAFAALPAEGYRISAGDLQVDLRELPWAPGTRVRLTVRTDLGRALVLVPEGVCVTGRVRAGAGGVEVFEGSDGGWGYSADLDRAPAPGSPALALDAWVGLGAVQVLHGGSEAGAGGPGPRPRRDHHSPTAADACPDPLAAS